MRGNVKLMGSSMPIFLILYRLANNKSITPLKENGWTQYRDKERLSLHEGLLPQLSMVCLSRICVFSLIRPANRGFILSYCYEYMICD